MTVSGVYKDLRDAGLIVTRPGAGTFVASPPASGVHDFDTMQRLEVRWTRSSGKPKRPG